MSFKQQLQSKIVSKEAALKVLNLKKSSGNKIVFTNGCLEIIHPGHVDYLSQARDLGDVLVVGLNTDNSVKRLTLYIQNFKFPKHYQSQEFFLPIFSKSKRQLPLTNSIR